MCCCSFLQGRNDLAIYVITRELGILTWDEAFLSLRSTMLLDQLRAKYCELIIGNTAGTLLSSIPLNQVKLNILFYKLIFTLSPKLNFVLPC